MSLNMARILFATRILFLGLMVLVLPALGRTAEETQRVPASDAGFHYEGRIDFANSNAPVIIWQASRISLDFSGDTIGLLFTNAEGQNFFNARLDGTNHVITIPEGAPPPSLVLSGLGGGRHHLTLFKRSEASAGTVAFLGVELPLSAKAWSPPPSHYKLRMAFIGDSITVGACNEDGLEDQWTNRLTHNAALSYATVTADAFSADHRNISVSGMGVATGWVPVQAGEIWNKLYPTSSSPLADLTRWTPQVVFVNLGENDNSFSQAHQEPFPTNYVSGYVSLVHAIRTAWPDARIVVLRGGMFGGAQSESLRTAWESVVAQLEAGDKGVSHFVFSHWTKTHPRVTDDRIMADELTAWLKQQPFMQTYL
jgi:lysophospholipase L1-like esterase